jgi:hypothetical protein
MAKQKKSLKELQAEDDISFVWVIGNNTDSGLVKGQRFRVRKHKAKQLLKAGLVIKEIIKKK